MNHKETFQKSPFAKGWLDLVDSAQFQAAANAAMLHFHDCVQPSTDMSSSAASEWRRQGARQFLAILMGLTLNPQQKPPLTGSKLDHTV